MPEYEFTLILNGDPEPLIDELFEAGCGDALFGHSDTAFYGAFDRDAPSFAEALSSAVAAIESVGLRVEHVEPDDLVTTAEIAARLGRSAQSVHQLATGVRGSGDFPAPVVRASSPSVRGQAKLWRWADVVRWSNAGGEDIAIAQSIAAINGALEARRRRDDLDQVTRLMVSDIVGVSSDTVQDLVKDAGQGGWVSKSPVSGRIMSQDTRPKGSAKKSGARRARGKA